jgi:hypothetical protein
LTYAVRRINRTLGAYRYYPTQQSHLLHLLNNKAGKEFVVGWSTHLKRRYIYRI